MIGRRRQGGFVLVLTMWVLAAIAIAASYFAERVQLALQLASARQGANDSLIALSDARAELLFRMGTQPMTVYGLGALPNPVALDGRSYQLGMTTVQLQDSRGLINLNHSPAEQMHRFLTTVGIAADQRAVLVDSLADYIDEDDLRRLNGAEAGQYKELGLRPPRNAPLLSTLELRQVVGWRDTTIFWQNSQLLELTDVSSADLINPNTASWQVLTALPNVTESIAKLIIERRQIEPVTIAWLDQRLGTQLQELPPRAWAFPSDTVRITQSTPGLPWALRYNVKRSPNGAASPWEIANFHRLPMQLGAERGSDFLQPLNAPHLPKFPPRVAEAASSALLFEN